MNRILILASFVAAVVCGCSKNDNPSSADTKGTMQVSMVDAPMIGYDSIVVPITSVEAHIADSTEGWVTLSSEARTYNLLALTNGAEALIGQASLSAGHYTQIRIVIGDSCWTYLSGVKLALKVPSAKIKLNVDATIEAGAAYKIVVDFDAAHSIVANANGLIMKPVLRVLTTEQTGFISGSVNVKAAVFAYGNGDTLSTVTGESNSFKLMYVQPGSYDVEILPSSDTYYSSTINGVVVTEGKTTTVGSITLQPK
jgi:hypothetical protein